jgi:hypothetical protein
MTYIQRYHVSHTKHGLSALSLFVCFLLSLTGLILKDHIQFSALKQCTVSYGINQPLFLN